MAKLRNYCFFCLLLYKELIFKLLRINKELFILFLFVYLHFLIIYLHFLAKKIFLIFKKALSL